MGAMWRRMELLGFRKQSRNGWWRRGTKDPYLILEMIFQDTRMLRTL
jgi:hypothetical protein